MSTQPKDGGPAFPLQIHVSPNSEIQYGMSLRDWFAGQALCNSDFTHTVDSPTMSDAQRTAAHCYRIADAMLAARERKEDAT